MTSMSQEWSFIWSWQFIVPALLIELLTYALITIPLRTKTNLNVYTRVVIKLVVSMAILGTVLAIWKPEPLQENNELNKKKLLYAILIYSASDLLFSIVSILLRQQLKKSTDNIGRFRSIDNDPT